MMMFGSTNAGNGGGYWFESLPNVISPVAGINELVANLDKTTFLADGGTGAMQLTQTKFVTLVSDLKIVHNATDFEIIQELIPTVKVFGITYNGEIQTNQISAGAPTAPANKRLPVYDTNGVLQGYIDLNT